MCATGAGDQQTYMRRCRRWARPSPPLHRTYGALRPISRSTGRRGSRCTAARALRRPSRQARSGGVPWTATTLQMRRICCRATFLLQNRLCQAARRRPPRPRPPEPAPNPHPNLQLHLHINWPSDLRITLTTSLLINYPSPMFMSLPIKLSVTGLVFNGEVAIAYEGERKRIHLCILDDLDPYGPAGDRPKRESAIITHPRA